jgi:galactose-1-phosphate uridylyltransferase
MVEGFDTLSDVDRAIATIKQIVERTKKLPPVLVAAYSEALEPASSEIVRRFFEELVSQCPDALEHFIEVDKQKTKVADKRTRLDTIA